MYKKVSTNLNFVDREKEVLEYLNENKIFENGKQGDCIRPCNRKDTANACKGMGTAGSQ